MVPASIDTRLTIEDQASNGTSITVDDVESESHAEVRIITDEAEIHGPPLNPGVRYTDLRIGLSPQLNETTRIEAVLHDIDHDESVASDQATITVDQQQAGIDPFLVEADPAAGFNYPYFLYAPPFASDPDPVPLLVESTNIPGPSDGLEKPKEDTQVRINRGSARHIADALAVPLVIPVFPRPVSTPVDWTHYTHQLDRETLQIDSGPLERIDRQLVAMVDDAIERLTDEGYPIRETFMMNGFSASAKFANRFAALHPDRVLSVTAGGLNGMALLPAAEVDNHPVPYQVGVSDFEAVTGTAFDLEAFRSVPQYLYMGGEDDSDTLLYPDAWTGIEARKAAILVFGEDIHEERFPTARSVYEAMEVPAAFRIYQWVGHTPRPAEADCIAFHHRCMNGEDPHTVANSFDGDLASIAVDVTAP